MRKDYTPENEGLEPKNHKPSPLLGSSHEKNPGFFRGVGRLVDLCELGPAGGYPDVTEYAEILPSKVIFGPPPKIGGLCRSFSFPFWGYF